MDSKLEAGARGQRWMSSKSVKPHHVLGLLLMLGCWSLPFISNDGLLLGVYASMFFVYALACRNLASVSLPTLLGLALAIRLGLVWHDPVLSDDLFRYVWEGRVWLAGHNPFVESPSSTALEVLRDSVIWPRINHPEVPTIYPPAAQALFALNALLGGGPILLRLIFIVIEFGCVAAVIKISRPSVSALGMYLLNPLVIVESAWSGHIDVVAVGFLAVGILLWETGRRTSSAFFGLSIATKFLGVIGLACVAFAPLRKDESWGARIRTLVLTGVVVVLCYAPCVPERPADLFSGFTTYAATWRSNDGFFRLWNNVAEASMASTSSSGDRILVHLDGLDFLATRLHWTKAWEGREIPNTTFAQDQIAQFLGKALGAGFVMSVFFFAVWVIRDPWQGFGVTMFALLLAAPTVHPWYVLWLVPFALRDRRGWSHGALVFSGLVLIGYLAWLSDRQGGEWLVPWWAAVVEFGVVCALALGLPRLCLRQRE
jgi:hypothetical protein